MKLGEFRRRTEDLPDSTELVIWDGAAATWHEANQEQFIRATPIHPNPVFVLGFGQKVELELDLAVRTGIDDGS